MLSQDVYTAILNQILDGTLQPGQLMNRRGIADQLGTSTAPVLEAMTRLESDGYLETLPRKGTQVRLITKADVIGSYVVRAGIEGMAIRIAKSTGALAAQTAALRPLAAEVDRVRALHGDAMETWKADLAFHLALVQTCANHAIAQSYRKVAFPNLFYRIHTITLHTASPDVCHAALLDALLAAPTADEAERLLRTHILARTEIAAMLGE